MTSHTSIKQNGVTPDYFTMIPNMAIMDLSANAYKLLAIYLDISKSGQIYAKNKTLSERLGTSVNTMKAARKELADKKYIVYSPGVSGAGTRTASVTVQVEWMWQENTRRMSKPAKEATVSHSDSTVSNIDTPLSKSDSVVSNPDTNKQELYNKNDKTISFSASAGEDEAPTAKDDKPQNEDGADGKAARQLIATYKSYSKNRDGSMFGWGLADAKKLVKDGITPEDVKLWYAEKSKDEWIIENKNGVPTWRMMVSEIVAHRDKNKKSETPKTIMTVDTSERGFITDSASEGVVRYEKRKPA